jgi:hypothetical protein
MYQLDKDKYKFPTKRKKEKKDRVQRNRLKNLNMLFGSWNPFRF